MRGLINIQFAVKGDEAFVLEANPRASRTVPFISKASGIPLAKVAARVMLGATLADLRVEGVLPAPTSEPFVAVKEAVMPWDRFPEQDSVLGPEMRATGEVMGVGPDAGVAYAKALLGAGHRLPLGSGAVLITLSDRDKPMGLAVAQAFTMLGFRVLATPGHGPLPGAPRRSCGTGQQGRGRPGDTVGRIEPGEVDLVINTPRGGRARSDGRVDPPCRPQPQGPLCHHHPGRPRRGPQPPRREDAITAPKSLQEWLAGMDAMSATRTADSASKSAPRGMGPAAEQRATNAVLAAVHPPPTSTTYHLWI